MSYQIIQEIEKEEARCGTCQSSVDELYHPLRECGMHTLYVRQSEEEENVMFQDTRETQFYTFPASSPDFSTDTSPEEMGDFLRRPTLIKTISWVPAGVSDADFDPWTLFFNTAEIKKKVDNFAYFRGNMHIKCVVNASPFYYGAMLINYTPTWNFVQAIDNTAVSALIPQSQKPHIWIDLRENMGGEMILPFVYQNNFVEIGVAAYVGDLGRLRNITYAGLRSANGATVTGVTVKIYAWLEEVELHGNTTALILQAKKEVVAKDEYGTGPISRPATALAHWASYLTHVPMIGTYAKATQIGAGAVASVAGLFGWSKIPVIENVKPVKPLFFHDLASAHISEPMNKMTLDPKAELSVDPKIVSASDGKDEMSISHLVQKDSFYFSTLWYTNDAPDTLLGYVNVSPYLLERGSPSNTIYQVGYTPMAYIAEMFSAWRGDIIFTIKVVCSQYHRGRLRVHWDPKPNTATGDISNQVLTKIVDIGEDTSIEFRVPYVCHSMWRRVIESPINSYSTSSVSGYNREYHNGGLSIRVLNNLSAPLDTSQCTVMIFARGAENLEFANPKALNNQIQNYAPQGMIEDADVEDKQRSKSPLDERYLVNWGEAVPSLRLLLQRSTLTQVLPMHSATGISDGSLMQRFAVQQGRFPTAPGYDPYSYAYAAGVITPGTQYRYAFTHHVPLTWITPMFIARRGAIQWHFHLSDPDKVVRNLFCTRSNDIIDVNDNALHGIATTVVNSDSTSLSSAAFKAQTTSSDGFTGAILTDNLVSPALSVEMPQMTMQRYQITRPTYITCGIDIDGSNKDTYIIWFYCPSNKAYLSKMLLSKYCNAGTDFSLSFFLCTPHMYYSPNSGQVVT